MEGVIKSIAQDEIDTESRMCGGGGCTPLCTIQYRS
jgi:hypothetical protein